MKRKVGLVIGYNGGGYFGLQYNKDLRTIEKDIMEVLLETECISEANANDPQKIGLKACSRTDKGVHASFNLVSAKIIREPTEQVFSDLRNALGKRGILLYKMVRLPKRFVGHKTARSRVYKYVLPTFFLQEGHFDEDWRKMDTGEPVKDRSKVSRTYHHSDTDQIRGYRSDAIDILREMMQCYIGTNNYHNFTVKSTQGDVRRFMRSIDVSRPFVSNDVEYVEVTIHGQSFLLHQIRKMVSFAVLNCKYSRESYRRNFELALSPANVHVPKCPSQYLFLSHVFFEYYNSKSKEEDRIEVDEEEKRRFEEEKIYPSVLAEENLLEWLKYFDAVHFHHEQFPLLSANE